MRQKSSQRIFSIHSASINYFNVHFGNKCNCFPFHLKYKLNNNLDRNMTYPIKFINKRVEKNKWFKVKYVTYVNNHNRTRMHFSWTNETIIINRFKRCVFESTEERKKGRLNERERVRTREKNKTKQKWSHMNRGFRSTMQKVNVNKWLEEIKCESRTKSVAERQNRLPRGDEDKKGQTNGQRIHNAAAIIHLKSIEPISDNAERVCQPTKLIINVCTLRDHSSRKWRNSYCFCHFVSVVHKQLVNQKMAIVNMSYAVRHRWYCCYWCCGRSINSKINKSAISIYDSFIDNDLFTLLVISSCLIAKYAFTAHIGSHNGLWPNAHKSKLCDFLVILMRSKCLKIDLQRALYRSYKQHLFLPPPFLRLSGLYMCIRCGGAHRTRFTTSNK